MVLLLYSDSVRDITKDSRTGNAFDEGHEIECFRMKSTGLKGLCLRGKPGGEPWTLGDPGHEVLNLFVLFPSQERRSSGDSSASASGIIWR